MGSGDVQTVTEIGEPEWHRRLWDAGAISAERLHPEGVREVAGRLRDLGAELQHFREALDRDIADQRDTGPRREAQLIELLARAGDAAAVTLVIKRRDSESQHWTTRLPKWRAYANVAYWDLPARWPTPLEDAAAVDERWKLALAWAFHYLSLMIVNEISVPGELVGWDPHRRSNWGGVERLEQLDAAARTYRRACVRLAEAVAEVAPGGSSVPDASSHRSIRPLSQALELAQRYPGLEIPYDSPQASIDGFGGSNLVLVGGGGPEADDPDLPPGVTLDDGRRVITVDGEESRKLPSSQYKLLTAIIHHWRNKDGISGAELKALHGKGRPDTIVMRARQKNPCLNQHVDVERGGTARYRWK